MSPAPFLPTLLIVDDDSVCVMGLQRSLTKAGVDLPVLTARDGREALDVLRTTHKRFGALPPMLVSLDLNMPRMNGVEFLAALRADPDLAGVIVLVCTTSDAEGDIAACYAQNVAGYIVKGRDARQFDKTAHLYGAIAQTITFPN